MVAKEKQLFVVGKCPTCSRALIIPYDKNGKGACQFCSKVHGADCEKENEA